MVAYLIYLVIIIVASFVQSTTLTLLAEVAFIVVGLATMVYSYGIFNIRAMSYLHSSHPEYARQIELP